MKTLGDYFSSKARTEVLRALCLLPSAVGVRPLARLTRLHPRSVELTLASLSREGLLIRHTKAGRSDGVTINRQHGDFERLRVLFETDMLAELSNRPSTLSVRAKSLCAFMDDGLALIQRGRRSVHDAQ